MIVHDLLISDIWFSFIAMMIAGAACGLCLAWTYALVVDQPSALSWIRYNLLFVAMYLVLGVASVLVYEPVTTVAEVIQANEPPDELFGRAMPLTLLFTLATAVILGLVYGRKPSHFGAILLTCIVLVALLGLNVSVLGLISIPSGSLYLIVELFALIVALSAVYAAIFLVLERRTLLRRPVVAV